MNNPEMATNAPSRNDARVKESFDKVYDALQKVWPEIEQGGLAEQVARIQADPEANKLTQIMAEGKSSYWRFPAGCDGRGRRVNWCCSCHRNVAGYFLGWREVRSKKGGERDHWTARKTKWKLAEMQRRRAERDRERRERTAGGLPSGA